MKTAHGFSLPLHVQRLTLGHKHISHCEMVDCQQYHLLVKRSGLSHSLCEHIRSVDYCTTTAREDILQQHVLLEMVEDKFFGEANVELCKARQKYAAEFHVPFSVLVELGGTQNKICFSVHKPSLHHYSILGRVTVTYDVKKNTWHCPCAKAPQSCPHKNIGKWHLFQTRKALFMTPFQTPTVPPTSPVTPHPVQG